MELAIFSRYVSWYVRISMIENGREMAEKTALVLCFRIFGGNEGFCGICSTLLIFFCGAYGIEVGDEVTSLDHFVQ